MSSHDGYYEDKLDQRQVSSIMRYFNKDNQGNADILNKSWKRMLKLNEKIITSHGLLSLILYFLRNNVLNWPHAGFAHHTIGIKENYFAMQEPPPK